MEYHQSTSNLQIGSCKEPSTCSGSPEKFVVYIYMWSDQAKWDWSQVKFNFHFFDWLNVSFSKLPFTTDAFKFINWFQDTGSRRVAKTIGNKEIICFVLLYHKISICKLWLILLDHITMLFKQVQFWVTNSLFIYKVYCFALTSRHWKHKQGNNTRQGITDANSVFI